ncbi:hypothetical protein HPB47_007018 [Ixodes persulcatus]|uniref:Uncharacterized protein n=1 Tax=Ixodes persulcatus TaxID=34615 RepID=A0AC60P8I8_IXOPE|nr:hypothetical protein HPB47_007018 [Ixodes persulcatus]
MVNAISKLQETIPAMIAQRIAHSLRPSHRPGGAYRDVSGRPLKPSRRTPEATMTTAARSPVRRTPFSPRVLASLNHYGEQP